MNSKLNKKEKHRECVRLFRINHPKSNILAHQKYNIKYPGRYLKLNKRWFIKHPDYRAIQYKKRCIKCPDYRNNLNRLRNPIYILRRQKNWIDEDCALKDKLCIGAIEIHHPNPDNHDLMFQALHVYWLCRKHHYIQHGKQTWSDF